MSVAVARGNVGAMVAAIVAMTLMIVLLDQVLWRPVVVWAQKFRVEEGGQELPSRSWLLDTLRRSRALLAISRLARRLAAREKAARPRPAPPSGPVARAQVLGKAASTILFGGLLVAIGLGGWQLILILHDVALADWLRLARAGLLTLGRVLLSCAIGTAWALPAGIAIGLSPRLSRALTPVAQVVASFPAPMLFPLVVAGLKAMGVSLGWGSVVLMLLGTQWYILFNVIAGASAMPSDLREAATSYRITGLQRFRVLYFPAVFPQLVTGWVTAAGGAWNASIVSEFVTANGKTTMTDGLGAQISLAASSADFPRLAASVVLMSALVVTFNRLVWRRLHKLAETRYSLSK
jgi:NitT/TauT family transport system permease protein